MSFWGAARTIVIFVNVAAMAVAHPDGSEGAWKVGLIAAAIFTPMLFVWLSVLHSSGAAVWVHPYNWNAPFHPITRYPFQFWLLASYSLLLGGVAGILSDVLFGQGNHFLTAFYLILGVSTLVTLQIWSRIYLTEI